MVGDVAGKTLGRAPLAPRLDGVVVELLEHSLKADNQAQTEWVEGNRKNGGAFKTASKSWGEIPRGWYRSV